MVFEKLGKATFEFMIKNPPTTRELKDASLYLKKIPG
jgi:hypothetical protein